MSHSNPFLSAIKSYGMNGIEEGVRSPASATCTGFGVREWKLITACFWPDRLKLFIHITP